MKPTNCPGGSFVSGRFSNFANSNIYKKNDERNSSNNINGLQDERRNSQFYNTDDGNKTTNFLKTTNTSRGGDYYSSTSSASTNSSAASPFIVFRSAKYGTPQARALQTLRNYAKYYVVVPAALFANRCKDAFYQLCGLFLLLATSPLWMLMIFGLFIFRRLRYALVKKFYPEIIQLRSSESSGIVNSIIWIRSKIDANMIRQRFKVIFSEDAQLHCLFSRRVGSRFGTKVWEPCEEFLLEKHIVETSKRIVDEPLKEVYRTGQNKSLLQKYVSHCASIPLDESTPPWKIHVISYISREDGLREKTCLVIRMHVSLIKNTKVQKALRELFLNPSGKVTLSNNLEELKTENRSRKSKKTEELLEDFHKVPVAIQRIISSLEGFYFKMKKLGITQQKSFTIWKNLRLKQLEFHSKTAVFSLMLIDTKDFIKHFLSLCEIFLRLSLATVVHQLTRTFVNLQAFAAMPMIILVSLLRKDRLKKLGLQKTHIPKKRLISWSDLLHVDLVGKICERSEGLSPENVMMMACSYALSDYYQWNNIPIPKKIGFTVSSAHNAICLSKMCKAVHIPGNERTVPQDKALLILNNIEEKTRNYPEWKMLGLTYVSKYLACILPSCLASKIQRSIVSCYPFSFTHVNLNSDSVVDGCNSSGQGFLPIRQLYGEIVEDFAFWPLPPLSDFGVSITFVHYAGKMRLFVMSPFQSMDTILTHRCNQYLIKLAEDVGVDRSSIPYSRRSSPTSTSCSTPQPIIPFINSLDNLGLAISSSKTSA